MKVSLFADPADWPEKDAWNPLRVFILVGYWALTTVFGLLVFATVIPLQAAGRALRRLWSRR